MSLGLIQLAVVGTVSGLQNNQAANTAFGAVATLFSGGTAPTAGNTGLSSPAGLPWRDTSVTPNQLKLRDDADTVWMPLWMIDQTGKVAAPYLSGINAQTGTTYTVAATDLGKLATFSNAGAIAVTLPQATTAGFGKGFWFIARCMSASVGSATITPTTSTIDGAASIVIRPGQAAIVVSDGANYRTSYVDAAVLDKANTFTAAQTISVNSANGHTVTGTSTNAICLRINNSSPVRDFSVGIAGSAGPMGAGYFFFYDNTAPAARGGFGPTGGMVLGAPTGLDKGAGTLNCTGLYINNVAVGTGTPYAVIVDQKASGTQGGTWTSGSWQTFDLNTEQSDASGIVSISSNQFTLAAGTYYIEYVKSCLGIGNQRHRCYNVTDAATAFVGQNLGDIGGATRGNLHGKGIVTIAGSKAFRIEGYSAATRATDGMGEAYSTPGIAENYLQILIVKLA